jgi:hypothetical protein
MSGPPNLHRLAGALDKRRREAATGKCLLHPDRDAVGWIESWDLKCSGTCPDCVEQGKRLGYTIHTLDELS